MRKELDGWSMSTPGVSRREAFSRFLIAVDELRARLNPQQYPNLEISDEGHLWFNLTSAVNSWEVFALPEGLEGLPGPSLMISRPHKINKRDRQFLKALRKACSLWPGASIVAASIPEQQELDAYVRNQLPALNRLHCEQEILTSSEQFTFYNCCGICLTVSQISVLEAEHLVRDVVNCLDEMDVHETEV